MFLLESSEVVSCANGDREFEAHLSHLMVQGHRNEVHKLNVDSYLEHARRNAHSDDFNIASHALNTLAIADQAYDVDLIYGIAVKQDRLYRSAVWSLIQMCNPESGVALLQLLEATEQERSQEIAELEENFERFANANVQA